MLEGRNSKEKFLGKFCHVSQNCCPEAYFDPTEEPSKQIRIKDDFGGNIYMSKEQFKALGEKAKAGEFAV